MANSLLDLYTFPKKKEVSVYPKNEMYNLLYKENPSIATPEVEPVSSSDSVVAQTAIRNANTPAKTIPDFSGALPTPMTQPKPQNVMAQTSTQTAPYTPQTEFEKYWKTPVGTEKYNIPLDQFVNIAGLAAKYLDPKNPVANDLIRMGGEAYKERARREYEGPNVLLQRQLAQEQLRKAREDMPKEWDIFLKANRAKGISDEESVKQFIELKRDKRFAPVITRDNQGNVYSVDRNTGEYSFIGNIGQDLTKQVKTTATGPTGAVTTVGKTGEQVSVLPGAGKPMVAPGAAGAAADARRQAREAQEGRKIKSTMRDSGTGQLFHITEGTEKNPPAILTEDKDGKLRVATPEEKARLQKVRTESVSKEAKSNPFSRGGTSTTPAVGTVIKGYRFKGGDPKLQSNWEKV